MKKLWHKLFRVDIKEKKLVLYGYLNSRKNAVGHCEIYSSAKRCQEWLDTVELDERVSV